MDPLSALLDGGERTLDLRVGAPWSVALTEPPTVTIVALAGGEAWCHGDEGNPLHLRTGDLAFLRPDGPRVLTNSCERPSLPRRGARTPVVTGASPAGDTHLFLRSFGRADDAAIDFLSTLGPERVFSTDPGAPLWKLMQEEAAHLSVATSSVLVRLVDLLFIDAVRRWVADSEAHGWARAVLDPVVGAALHLFHDEPGHQWTLQEVADRVGTSRTSLSRRFQLLVGEPPMTYLRQWRLTRAATLLAQEEASVATVARRSGFADPFEFSAAFSKKFGLPPSRYRDREAYTGA
ncbi:AraC family transcriptional regulator [Mobilicoccus massiliensis]|uniref:AraC family transcriptional regulator n=1 Tax=Mobilicoccus massiliensis TaxID=1522310 RepID=UPI00058B9E03|nr:AraC family transcriptional regulator [Mobilicoccus massiliensis]